MDQKISKFLIQLRICKGNTQNDLANYLNVSNKTISKWENGVSLPETNYIPQIAEYYNVSCDELLNGNYVSKEIISKKTILSIFIIIATIMCSFVVHFITYLCLINDDLRLFKIIVFISLAISIVSAIGGFIFSKRSTNILKILYILYFTISILNSIIFILEYVLIII